MIKHGDTIVVGVSGGADSMALLQLLFSMHESLQIKVIAAHVHHGIRGAAADADERLVKEYCAEQSIPFFSKHVDVPAAASQCGESLETAARNLRYKALDSVCSGAIIATAHTLSDACETFLFHFARGTGLPGLCGIPPVRGNIIRPLLYCTAEETRAYCAAHAIPYRDDESNFSDAYARNRIRMGAIPALQSVNEGFAANAMRCMHTLRKENEYLDALAAQALHECACTAQDALKYTKLQAMHPVLFARALRLYCARFCASDVSRLHITLLSTLSEGGAVTLPGGTVLCRKNNMLAPMKAACATTFVQQPLREEACVYRFNEKCISVTREAYNPTAKYEKNAVLVDAEKVSMPVFRARAPGDRLRLASRGCSKSMKQLFEELHVPISQRSTWPVLADANGVIWVYQCPADESRLPDLNTKKILVIQIGEK